MAAIAHPDGPLRLARQRLEDAVRAFADPVPERVDGSTRWADPLYARLRAALCSAKGQRRGPAQRSRLPCRVDVLALLCEILIRTCRSAKKEQMATLKWHEHETKRRGLSAAHQASTGDHTYLVYENRDGGWWIRRCMVRHPYEEELRGPVTDLESAQRLAEEWAAQPTTGSVD